MKKISIVISALFFLPISLWALDYDLSDANSITETTGAYIGKRVSAGDVNNDGYDDMFINSNQELYINYGSNTLSGSIDLSTPDVHVASTLVDITENFISAAGDINNDGYDDMVVGTPLAGGNAPDTGAVFIIYGSNLLDSDYAELYNAADVYFPSNDSSEYTGWSVSSAGDYNSDGYDDILVGSPYNDDNGTNRGLVYLIYGGLLSGATDIDAIASVTFYGESDEDDAGYAVASAGDVNNDGYDDILISAHGYGASNNGAAYIVYGQASYFSGSNNLSTADVKIVGENDSDAAGYNLSSAGDVNGDGYSDILIGAGGDDTNGSAAGAAYIIYGSNNLSSSIDLADADVKLLGEAAADFAGEGVAAAGDVNHDGYGDLLIGVYGTNSLAGAAYLVLGSASLTGSVELFDSDVKFIGEDANDQAGYSMFAGDFNGDRFGDILIGAWTSDNHDAGMAYYSYLYIDSDSDGVAGDTGILSGTDCNDADNTVYENQTYYQDADGDGLGNPEVLTSVCSSALPEGYVSDYTDQNDNDYDNDGSETGTDCNDADNTVYENQTYYQDADGDGLGNPEVSTSVCSSIPPEGYVTNSDDADDAGGDDDNGGDEPPLDISDEDPEDQDAVNQYLQSVSGDINGQIEVTYTDSSVYYYTVFNLITEKLTVVEQYPNTAYYLVLQPYGKKLALVNVFNGETLTSKQITKKSYKKNSIKLYTIRDKKVVAVTSHKKSKNRLTIFRLKISETKLTKKDTETVKNKNIKASKTKKHKNYIHLKNKNGKTLAKYYVTKKYNLKLK